MSILLALGYVAGTLAYIAAFFWVAHKACELLSSSDTGDTYVKEKHARAQAATREALLIGIGSGTIHTGGYRGK